MNLVRPNYLEVIDDLDLNIVLKTINHTLIGTPPLMIDVANSDIDIACYAQSPKKLYGHFSKHYGSSKNYRAHFLDSSPCITLIISFEFSDWEIEFFIQNQPLHKQNGVRHFNIEKRLLAILGEPFKKAVIALKNQNIKTEPAFAHLLNIKGDPYVNLLKLENLSDQQLSMLYQSHLN
ncbi:DUF4269 domain-containing protein [Kiloniella antarctica]|uniref:DUF4269 domain-containing protein n=1 Tax=Kiloniella antarctica TaxID=1550907 RepID=A0ABW5BGW8_9PROT